MSKLRALSLLKNHTWPDRPTFLDYAYHTRILGVENAKSPYEVCLSIMKGKASEWITMPIEVHGFFARTGLFFSEKGVCVQ
jgi:hypothetical protein